MTTNTSAFNQYKENSINTASPEELTLVLYNGLIRFIMQAQKAIDNKDIPKAHNSTIRAIEIILEFQATLNMKYPISHNFALLYDYMHRRLIDANIKKDKEILDEVLGYGRELRDTWAQAMKLLRQSQEKSAVAK